MAPNSQIKYLTRLHYVEEDRLMVAEFENGAEKETLPYKFFPFLLTDCQESDISLLLSTSQRRMVWFEDLGTVLKVISPSFSLLRHLKENLEQSLGRRGLLPLPQTQFLIQNQWRLFEAFEFQNGGPKQVNDFHLPFTSFGFLSNNLHVELRELLSTDESVAKSVCAVIFYAYLLRTPIEELPKSSFERRELFLQNLFFENLRLPVRSEGRLEKMSLSRNVPLHVFENTAEFDFSQVLVELSGKSFFNLGFETVNCECCAPGDASASNLLPHSMVRVRILSDGFFSESIFPRFAIDFHSKNNNKQSRQDRMEEFGYLIPPLGPFSMGELVSLPLADAQKIESSGDGLIVGLIKAEWFCKKTESTLSAGLSSLSGFSHQTEMRVREAEKTALAKNNLGGFYSLSVSPAYFFDKAVITLATEFSADLAVHLTDSSSRFFFLPLGQAMEACHLVMLSKFFDFNAQKGKKTLVPWGSTSVFVQGESGFGLAKQFADQERFPLPIVKDWHFWSV